MKTVATALRVARSNLAARGAQKHGVADRAVGGLAVVPERVSPSADEVLLPRIEQLVGERPSYGYRRVTAMLNRLPPAGQTRINHKRVYRIMRRHKLLLERSTGRPQRIHDGTIITLKSNMRWCSDAFEIQCWNGERVRAAFSLDCCDREIVGYVATSGFVTGEMIRDLMVHRGVR